MKNIFILLLVFCAFACRGELNKSAEQLQNDGKQYRTQENLKESITSFKSIISKFQNIHTKRTFTKITTKYNPKNLNFKNFFHF